MADDQPSCSSTSRARRIALRGADSRSTRSRSVGSFGPGPEPAVLRALLQKGAQRLLHRRHSRSLTMRTNRTNISAPSTAKVAAAYGQAPRRLVRLVQIGSSMKLVTFSAGTGPRVGVVDADAGVVRDVTGLLPAGAGVLERDRGWAELGPVLAARAKEQPAQALDEVTAARADPGAAAQHLLRRQELPRPRRRVRAQRLRQPDRSEAMPEHPVVFSKATTVGHRPVRRHRPAPRA